jgi:putative heme-binding domain-containing protein
MCLPWQTNRISMPQLLIAILCLVLVQAASRAATRKDGLPSCPPDWKLEVIAEAPNFRHPSAVCVAPDGRVFVGQDPMDMASASDIPTDYILCFHPNGKITVFATNLYAVYGLSYLDGKLYVHHCPKLTVFRDEESIGRDPVDLFQTNPRPWDGGFNDHIPANLHYAMDGYFYLATGDKGIYGAVGKDGSKAELQGGGIIRFRPDGTQLEVYSSGTRNHLDAAINDEMEMFTYDNTDDGNGWWTRVTHMVDRGWYGYPHDYKPHRPYTLWMMKDYGGGSPTGAIGYNEDALPAEYRGNLFMSEWGKGELARFVVERDGGTYRIVSRTAFLKGAEQFRPVGVDVSADGMSLYVADWNHNGWKNKLMAGRFLKVTYTGKSLAAPKPAWYLPAALGKTVSVSVDELLQGLRHPSERVRLTAQRMLAKQGVNAATKLQQLVSDESIPAKARAHAIWALDAIDGTKGARAAIIKCLTSEDALARRQAARQLGTRAAKETLNALTPLLKDSDKSVRFQAATALGRIADAGAVPALTDALDETDLFARYAAFTALNHIGRTQPSSWSTIAEGLRSENNRIREGTRFAMRETFEPGNVQALAAFVANNANSAEARCAALEVLAELHRKPLPWNGKWWHTQPVKSPPPAKVTEWEGTPLVLASINSSLKDRSPEVRLAAVHGAQTARDPESVPVLAAMFENEKEASIQRAIIDAMGAIRGPVASTFVSSVLDRGASFSGMLTNAVAAAEQIGGQEMISALIRLAKSWNGVTARAAIIEALGGLKANEAIPLLVEFAHNSDAAMKEKVANALAAIGGDKAVTALIGMMSESDLASRKAVITALGNTKHKGTLEPLLSAWADKTTRTEAIMALTQRPDLRALDAYLGGLDDKNSTIRDAARRAMQSIQREALPILEQRAEQGSLSAAALTGLQKVYEKNAKAKDGVLFAKNPKLKTTDPAIYAAFASRNKGDRKHGKMIFADLKGVACSKCHKAEGQGGDVGPDLNSVGAKYSRSQIIEHILYPSKIILDGYQQTTLFLKDGDAQSGIVRGETPEDVTLLDTEGKKHVIARKQIEERRQSELSLMPEGLQIGLSLEDFADLVSYLENLKDQPIQAAAKK